MKRINRYTLQQAGRRFMLGEKAMAMLKTTVKLHDAISADLAARRGEKQGVTFSADFVLDLAVEKYFEHMCEMVRDRLPSQAQALCQNPFESPCQKTRDQAASPSGLDHQTTGPRAAQVTPRLPAGAIGYPTPRRRAAASSAGPYPAGRGFESLRRYPEHGGSPMSGFNRERITLPDPDAVGGQSIFEVLQTRKTAAAAQAAAKAIGGKYTFRAGRFLVVRPAPTYAPQRRLG